MDIYVPPIRYTRRWFCYLDLLGFSQLVRSETIDRILPLYERALQHVEAAAANRQLQGVSYSWFSDTFIMYSRGDSPKEFTQIEQAGRLFFQELILARIPVRGALSWGDLYSQKERNVFIGQALIDAYAYGEGQDWLGFAIAPSAANQMGEIGIPVQERAHYRSVPPEGYLKPGVEGPVFAFAFNNAKINNRNPYLEALKEMRAAATGSVREKYDRTIDFLKAHHRKGGTYRPDAAA